MRVPELRVNLSVPQHAARTAALAVDGVGLLRAEFLMSMLGHHPASLDPAKLADKLEQGLRTVAEAFYPRPVVYRVLDAKSNEMRSLMGGDAHEPVEENPALGLRGASRVLADDSIFLIEVAAISRLRRAGLANLQLMLPFVRVPAEVDACWSIMESRAPGFDPSVELWVMAEVPSLALRIGELPSRVHGVSVGTNDLTQLMYGADRDNPALAGLYEDGVDGVVLELVLDIVAAASARGMQTCVCGDVPSRSPAVFDRLVSAGISAVSVSPEAVASLRDRLTAAAAAG
jgi:pyruvate,water dikinase